MIAESEFGISAQVLAEFYATVTSKGPSPMRPEDALAWVERMERQTCLDVTGRLVKLGAVYAERYRLAYWDGAILAAADLLEADTLYTEDLNHGQMYGSVRVVNPFLGS